MGESRKDTSGILIVYTVTAICLIAKVWIIRHLLHLQVDVLELIIPTILPGFHQALVGVLKKRESRPAIRWDHPLYWSIAIVLITGLTLIPYL